MKRINSLFIVILFFVGCKPAPPPTTTPTQTTPVAVTLPEPSLNFLVITDWGIEKKKGQKAVAKQMAKVAEKNKIDFIISGGDHFNHKKVRSAKDKLWKTNFEDIYAAPSLQIPWYACLGNHDYYGSVQAQIDYSKKSPRWNMPARFYSIEKEIKPQSKVAFIFLDTSMMFDRYYKTKKSRSNLIGWNKQTQFDWLSKTLSQTKADWKIVIGHHPVFSAHTLKKRIPLWKEIRPRLAKYNVDAYFSGHEHDFQHTRVAETDYFVSGAGAIARKGHESNNPKTLFFQEDTLGFLLVSVTAEQMKVQFIDSEGSVFHTTLIEK